MTRLCKSKYFKDIMCIIAALALLCIANGGKTFVSVEAQNNSSYINPAIIVTEILCEEDLNAVKNNDDFDIVILNIDKNLNVIDKNSNVLANFNDIKDTLKSEVALFVKDESAVDVAKQYISQNPYTYIVSQNPEIVKDVRESCQFAIGMIDFRNAEKSAVEIRNIANSSLAKTVLLGSGNNTKEDITILRKLVITTFVAIQSEDDFFKAVTAGANGVISDDLAIAQDCLQTVDSATLTAAPLMIAHRGLSGEAMANGGAYLENTVSAAKNSYFDYGADLIEIDLKLTADNKVVIMHDDDLARTTTGTGNIEEYTSTQLSQFMVDGGYSDTTNQEPIPYLEDFLKAFKETDLYFFLEIKTLKQDIMTYTKDIIDKYDMSDRVSFISFHKEQLKRASKIMPEVSVGLLEYGKRPSSKEYLSDVLSAVLPLNASYHPDYSSADVDANKNLLRSGVTCWTWTYTSKQSLFQDIREIGFSGYTTDYVSFLEQSVKTITPLAATVGVGDVNAVEMQAKLKTFGGEEFDGVCSVFQIGGEGRLSKDNFGKYFLNDEKSCIVVYKYYDSESRYSLISEPVTIEGAAPYIKKGCKKELSASFFIFGAFAAMILVKNRWFKL